MKQGLMLLLFVSLPAWAAIPATPVLTFYQFNGDLDLPYYRAATFQRSGASPPAGRLSQGTSLIPCLVIRNGRPLATAKGTPYVGFEIVVDSRTAARPATEKFKRTVRARQAMTVTNHHCAPGVEHVVNVRKLYPLEKAPFFDPPRGAVKIKPRSQGYLDQIVRAFHNSPRCAGANRRLFGRRGALQRAWQGFIRDNGRRWPKASLERAKHLDYTMRTAIFEGHLDRGCSAYGACERNVVALSIRNRAREACSSRQGCRFPGDFQGVASKVSQYHIWDEYLTQISGLTSCFLRDDLGDGGNNNAGAAYYAKLQRMYRQNLDDVQRIMFGGDRDLRTVFPGASLYDVTNLRHYYHPPAMGKCFPDHRGVEYMTGAIARRGGDFALIANTRIRVDRRVEGGYLFQSFRLRQDPDRDVITFANNYPGFVVDGRKVSFRRPASCSPYGIPRGCRFGRIGRYRKTPSWLSAGKPLELMCRIEDRGEGCRGSGALTTARVGGVCDTEMRPVSGVR
jgi:hypothetical protein